MQVLASSRFSGTSRQPGIRSVAFLAASPLFAAQPKAHKVINGGSFDPFHVVHLELAKAIRDQSGLEVELFPVGSHSEKTNMSSFTDRFEMTRLGIQGEKGISVNDVESRLPFPTTTLQTLRHLYPDFDRYAELHGEKIPFGLGLDVLKNMPNWGPDSKILARNLRFFVAPRGGDEIPDKLVFPDETIPIDVVVVKLPSNNLPKEMSSTEVRRRVREGLPITGMVPAAVEKYIYEKGLYGAQKPLEKTSGKTLAFA